MTDAWDASNPEHKKISHGIEVSILHCSVQVTKLMIQVGDGIAEMRTIADARKALKSVGFEILHEEDLADRMSYFFFWITCAKYAGADHVPWYYPLEGDLTKAQTWWDCKLANAHSR